MRKVFFLLALLVVWGEAEAQLIKAKQLEPMSFRDSARVAIRDSLVLLHTDGSASGAAYSWRSDPNTGLYRLGPDSLALAAGGTAFLKVGAGGVPVGLWASASIPALRVTTGGEVYVGGDPSAVKFGVLTTTANSTAPLVYMWDATSTGTSNQPVLKVFQDYSSATGPAIHARSEGAGAPVYEDYSNATKNQVIQTKEYNGGGARHCEYFLQFSVSAETDTIVVQSGTNYSVVVEVEIFSSYGNDTASYYRASITLEEPSGVVTATTDAANRLDGLTIGTITAANERIAIPVTHSAYTYARVIVSGVAFATPTISD